MLEARGCGAASSMIANMTEEPKVEDADSLDEEQSESWESHQYPDEVLAMLADIANRGGVGMGITLNVQGQIVCGDVCSGAVFFEEIAEVLRSADVTVTNVDDEEQEQTVRGAVGLLADAVAERAQNYGPDAPQLVTAYIHLKNAELWDPSGRHVGVRHWRGRLVDVSGWSLGRFSGQ